MKRSAFAAARSYDAFGNTLTATRLGAKPLRLCPRVHLPQRLMYLRARRVETKSAKTFAILANSDSAAWRRRCLA